jgi:hypothetical protein
MMENYFNVFKSPSIKIENNFGVASKLDEAEKSSIISNISLEKYSNAGVQVSISEEGLESSKATLGLSKPKVSIYQPTDGVMVKKDSAEYISDYKDMNRRISMVEVQTNEKPSDLGSGSLEDILSSIESKGVDLVALVEKGTGYAGDNVKMDARVELGNIRGGGFAFDQEGNIIAQKYVGVIDTLENESQMNLSLITDSGKDISIKLSLADRMSQQGAIGVSRDMDFSYSTSESLNDEEIAGLNSVLESLQGSFSSFHDGYSISKSEADELKQVISANSKVFSSMDMALSKEFGAINRAITINLNTENSVEISTKEEGMEIAYETSTLKAEVLQRHMGDNPVNENINLMIDRTRDASGLYKAAIDDSGVKSALNYGEYISSFFDTDAA